MDLGLRTFTGAWIETPSVRKPVNPDMLRTFTGAWIETRSTSAPRNGGSFAPSRVRGLKLCIYVDDQGTLDFAPSRVRGLKLH